MTSYIMEQHQKNASGNGLMVGQMLDTFRLPKDFDSLVYLSMALQAEGIRYGVEHWRRHNDRVAGTLYWQLNDCWPVASWSSLDYFGRWKALHYAARRFYAPVMLSIEDHPPEMGIHVTSDLREPWEGVVHWSLETLEGDVLISGKSPVNVSPMISTQVCALDFSDRVPTRIAGSSCSSSNCGRENGGPRCRSQPLSLPSTSRLPSRCDGELCSRGRPVDRGVDIPLAGAFARAFPRRRRCRFQRQLFRPAGWPDSFHLCPLPAHWTPAQARAALKIRSVYDSYAHAAENSVPVLLYNGEDVEKWMKKSMP